MAGYGEQCWEFLVGDDFNGAKLDGFEGASVATKPCVVAARAQTQVAEGPTDWANEAGPLTSQAPTGVTEPPPKCTRLPLAPPGRTVRRTMRISLLVATETGRRCAPSLLCSNPPWKQPRGKWMFFLVNSHANATSKRWHLWEIDLRFAPGSPPGWLMNPCLSLLTLSRMPLPPERPVRLPGRA